MAKKPRTSFQMFMDGVFNELNGNVGSGGFEDMGRHATKMMLEFERWMKKA